MNESRFTVIVRSLKQHWPARKLEWLMTIFVTLWGFYVLAHPILFIAPATSEPLQGLSRIAHGFGFDPAPFWGSIAVAMGFLRGLGLFINGAYARTPIWRAVAAFGSMFIFTQISIAVYQSGVPNLGLVIYPWLVAVDLLSAYRAGQDAVYAEMQRCRNTGVTSAALPYVRAD